jgi:hypothetical protein
LICTTNDDNEETLTIESNLISKANLFGNGEEGIPKQNLIVSDVTTWENLITQMNPVTNVSNNFSETNIDFSKYKIIAVFDEIKANGGHRLELDIETNLDNIIIGITDIAPEGNATTVITQPFHIVKITNSDLPILFE